MSSKPSWTDLNNKWITAPVENAAIEMRSGCLDLIIWGILGLIVFTFFFITLIKGIFNRMGNSKKQLNDKISNLENRIKDLENKK